MRIVSVFLSLAVALCVLSIHVDAFKIVPKSRSVSKSSTSSSSSSLRMHDDDERGNKNMAAAILATSATMVVSMLLQPSFMIQPAHASDASKLYFEAEEAIKVSEGNFKDLSSKWAKNKKMIESSYKKSAQAEELTKNVAKLLSDANSKLTMSTTDQAENKGKLEAYINDMTVATQKKYEEANEAAQSNGKPAVTAKKFLEAKNSATIGEEEIKTLKILQDAEAKSLDQLTKLQTVVSHLEESQGTIKKGRELSSKSLSQMQDGISNLYASCKDSLYFCSSKDNQGLKTFVKGLDDLGSSNEKYFNKVVSALRQDQRSLENIEKTITVLSDNLGKEEAQISLWEEETKLRANVGKQYLKQTGSKLNSATKSISNLKSNFDKSLDALSKLNDDDKAAVKESKSTLRLLEKSEGGAKNAEGLLKKAKEVGDKEAALYLQRASKVAGSSVSISTSSKAAAIVNSNNQ